MRSAENTESSDRVRRFLAPGLLTGSAPLPGGGAAADRRHCCWGPRNRTSHPCNRIMDHEAWPVGRARVRRTVRSGDVVPVARHGAVHHSGRSSKPTSETRTDSNLMQGDDVPLYESSRRIRSACLGLCSDSARE